NLDRLLITSGGMQGLDLGFKLFVSPGDLVACESPTYTNGSATAMSYEADILELPVDDEGMQVEVLEEHTARTGRPPKVIYTIPTFQNPAGVTMTCRGANDCCPSHTATVRSSSRTTPTACCASRASPCRRSATSARTTPSSSVSAL